MRLGFFLLTHCFPRQIARLAGRLARLFPDSPILIHHDGSRCTLRGVALPDNAEVVEVPGPRRWSTFDIVEAELDAVARMLAMQPPPDVILQISGQCYPLKPAAAMLDFFARHPADALLDAQAVSADPAAANYDEVCTRRYFPAPPQNLRERIFPPRRSPFTRTFQCYKGSAWIALAAHAARRMLAWHAAHPAFARYYHACNSPDESYRQTIVCNDAELMRSPLPLHHIRWIHGQPNPAILGPEDWPALAATSYLFARKFDMEKTPELLDRIDRELLGL